jgi:Glycosyl hydrolase 36 superfamily, catalytic domain/Glycosyltransferase family 36
LTLNRRRFVLNSLGSVLAAPPILSMLINPDESHAASTPPAAKPYGSGHFGEWIEDEFGLPAYRYTCDQTTDPKAVTPVTPGILAPIEHIHQVGNDRIIAIASNNGTVRVRQDEGAPKFLNDYAPENHQFAGGIGYLTDGNENLSTFYEGNSESFERIFGIGYFRKRVSGKSFHIDQVLSAPFGDDPALLSQVTIANHGSAPANIRWIEYWGCQNYQFSQRSFIESFSGQGSPVDFRRKFGERFNSRFETVDGNIGLLQNAIFAGRAPQEEALWQRMKAMLANNENTFISAIPEESPKSFFDDLQPLATFLVSLDGPADSFSTNGAAFFGSGGAHRPSGLGSELDNQLSSRDARGAMLIERKLRLQPGQSRTLRFLYGYLPTGFELAPRIARHKASAASSLKDSSAKWKSSGLRFTVETEPWIARETIWNHYSLRSSLTYDDFFEQHLLNQNGFYEYVMGFQGAARDPLQHSLPFIFSDPEIVKSILRYTLKEVRFDGSLPYAIAGHGVIAPMVADNASDLPLWLLWAASEYILATRDLAFLDEQITSPLPGPAPRADIVRNLLARCYRHQVDQVGVGEHGIARMLNDDWNDGLLGTFASKAFKEAAEKGESVLNSAMSAWVFDYYARMLTYANQSAETVQQIRQTAASHRQAARRQWTGKWFRRAWLGPTLGWLGESTLWIEPQPWAILAGATTPDQSRALIQTVDALLRRTSPIGATQMGEGPDMKQGEVFLPGTCVNGGVWPSLNQTLVWALATVDPAMAWDEWKKNSLARHAEAYPSLWYGIWSGTDSYNSTVSEQPGESVNNKYFHGPDFPVLNLHSHACSLYSISKLIGLEFNGHGLSISPELPVESYRFESPLIGVIKSPHASYEGWYAPSQSGEWIVKVNLPQEIAGRIVRAEVNGSSHQLKRISAATFEFTGRSEPGKPLRWLLKP